MASAIHEVIMALWRAVDARHQQISASGARTVGPRHATRITHHSAAEGLAVDGLAQRAQRHFTYNARPCISGSKGN